MRALIFELRPESLEAEGLVASLGKQAASLRTRHETAVQASLGEEPDLSPETRDAVYRIPQAALHNTVKRARASCVRISLAAERDHLHLTVSDDGVGYDPQGDFPGHLGLQSMRERASNLGGTLEIRSAPGHGTTLEVRLPTP